MLVCVLIGAWVFLVGELAVAAEVAVSKPAPDRQKIEVELLATLDMDGDLHDLSGVTGSLEDGSPADQFGGLSAMEYSGSGNRFYLLADRGAGDGEVTYQCRFHEAELTVDASTHKITCQLIATRMFATPDGEPVVGSIIADQTHLVSTNPKHQWTALDPEGLRLLADGSLLLSDEYGPHVVVADRDGHVKQEFPIPEKFLRRAPREGGVATRGVAYNRGLEGIAITPSGNRVLAVPQSPLVQDSVRHEGMSLGVNCRCILFDAKHDCERELVYTMDSERNGLSEILAIDEHRFLVLERDGKSGSEANHKKIYLVDIRTGSDVQNVEALPESGLPTGVTSMTKTLFIDFLDPRFEIPHENIKEKAEGMCWGPRLADGRRTLWVCYDNDFESSIQTEFDCFAVSGME